MIGKSYIDGADIFAEFGVFVTQGGYDDLVSFPPLKPVPANDWPEEDGEEPDLSNPVLDTKEVLISFAAIKGNTASDFIIALSDKGYHSFIFNEIEQSVTLRLVSQKVLKIGPGIESFSLAFADDFPLPGYAYLAPAGGTTSDTGYKLDGRILADYGVLTLQGTKAEMQKAPAIKQRLQTSDSNTPGATCDDSEVIYQAKMVTINCLMKADTLAGFWRNYNALLFDLTRAGEHQIAIDSTSETFQCYYDSARVSRFYPTGKIWCEFSLTLKFIDFRYETNKYKYPPFASKLAAIFIYKDNATLLDKLAGLTASIEGGSITWPEIPGSDVFNFSDPTFWNNSLLNWYASGTPRRCPASFLQGVEWAEAATDSTHARLFHKDYATAVRNILPVLIYNQDMTSAEVAEIVDWLNWYYTTTYDGAVLIDRTGATVIDL